MKVFGIGLFYATMQVFKVLWPGQPEPSSPKELADRLMLESQGQLNAWRASACREGAKEAMAFVLSWYEHLDLDAFQAYRPDSKWCTEEELIQERRRVVYSFLEYADIHNFCPPLPEHAPAVQGEEDPLDETESGKDLQGKTEEETGGNPQASILEAYTKRLNVASTHVCI